MNELALINNSLTIEQVLAQRKLVMQAMKAAMTEGVHYGTIPGCGDKPTLLQGGAQLLCSLFKLTSSYDVKQTELVGGNREYHVNCTLTHGQPGNCLQWEGVGMATTMESKHRYRNATAFEVLDCEIPRDSKEKKAEYRKQGFGMKQVSGQWVWVKYGDASKTENPDPADQYNTVLKMAKKRAYVDATITATASNDLFTQDLEDIRENLDTMKENAPESNRRSEPDPEREREQPREEKPTESKGTKWEGVIVKECKYKEGEYTTGSKKGQKWTLYIVSFTDNREVTTFSETLYGECRKLGEAGANCIATVEPTPRKEGKFTITAIEEEDNLP